MLMSWGNTFEPATSSSSYTDEVPDLMNPSSETIIQGLVAAFVVKNLIYNGVQKFIRHFDVRRPPKRALSSPEGDLGNLEALMEQKDAFLYMLTFLETKDLANLFLVSRKMNFYVSEDFVWRRLFEKSNKKVSKEIINTMRWKDLYKKIHTWKWDLKNRGAPIEVSEDGYLASRNEHQGSNPAILATHPFTKLKDYYDLEIKSRGAWIGIGIADREFKVANASTLGTQSNCVNSAFFCQDSTLLQMYGSKENVFVAKRLENGDRIRVQVNYDENTVYYYRNGQLEGKLLSRIPMKEDEVYPCVNLSFKSSVNFINA